MLFATELIKLPIAAEGGPINAFIFALKMGIAILLTDNLTVYVKDGLAELAVAPDTETSMKDGLAELAVASDTETSLSAKLKYVAIDAFIPERTLEYRFSVIFVTPLTVTATTFLFSFSKFNML